MNLGDSMHRANRTQSCMQDLVADQLEYLAILAAQSVVLTMDNGQFSR